MGVPLPHSAIQHTRAVVALAVTQSNLEMGASYYPGFAKPHVATIGKYAEQCASQTRLRSLSAGARRDMDRCFEMLSSYLELSSGASDMGRRHAALFYAALTFVEDVRYTCPLYWSGKQKRAWGYLLRVMTTLAGKLCAVHAELEAEGTRVYEKAAWALASATYEIELKKMGIHEWYCQPRADVLPGNKRKE